MAAPEPEMTLTDFYRIERNRLLERQAKLDIDRAMLELQEDPNKPVGDLELAEASGINPTVSEQIAVTASQQRGVVARIAVIDALLASETARFGVVDDMIALANN